jgi:hypothetical protein
MTARIAFVVLILIVLSALNAAADVQRPDAVLFRAIAQVESHGNASAHNSKEDAVGIVQIRPIVVEDVNRINKLEGRSERFDLNDRYSPDKSRRMFDVYLTYYGDRLHRLGKPVTYQTLAKTWNGGPDGYKKSAAETYWQKVKRELDK